MKNYRVLTLLLCMAFLMALTACSSKNTSSISTGEANFAKKDLEVSESTLELTKENITGLWSQGENLYYFAPDGQFISFTNTDIAGGSWGLESQELIVQLYDKSLNPMIEEVFTGVIKDESQMLLVGQGNHKSVWERSSEKVGSSSVEFFIRERVMLPPVVKIEVKASQDNKSRFVSRTMYKTAGSNSMPMQIYYLADRINAKAKLEVEAIVYFENSYLFVTPKTALVPTNSTKTTQIMLVQPSADTIAKLMAQNVEQLASLENTYWKVIKLEGKTPKIENAELHMILRHGDGTVIGEGGGSDGCNNFFFTWQRPQGSKNTIDINLGGSTMMLCQEETMQQAMQFMQNLDKINTFRIQGNNLLLQENKTTRIVFEAVAL